MHLSLLNELAFRARSSVRWSAAPRKRLAGDFEVLAARLSPRGRQRLCELRRTHRIESMPAVCSVGELHESIYALDVLSRLVPSCGGHRSEPIALRGLDVGAKSAAYLPGLAAATGGPWDAIELDAHRRYANLATRRAYGERMAAALPGCRYLCGDVIQVNDAYDVITWFLPFVVLPPLLAWGLPRRCFQPAPLLRHVVGLLAPGGVLLIVNQGAAEWNVQRTLLDEATRGRTDLFIEAQGEDRSLVSPFRKPRFATLVRRANPSSPPPGVRNPCTRM